MILHILLQESGNEHLLSTRIEVVEYPFKFFIESLLGFLEVGETGGLSDNLITLNAVVILGLSDEGLLELVLIQSF